MLLDILIRVCPKCGEKFQRTELMSYSVFGNSQAWSDGRDGSMEALQEITLPFGRCPLCNQLIWIEDAKVVDDEAAENPDAVLRMDYPSSNLAENPQAILRKDALRLSEDKALSAERRLILSLLIWRCINDEYRKFRNALRTFRLREALKTRRQTAVLQKTKREQMKELLSLTEEVQNSETPVFDEQEELLLKIELLRELGRFSKAKKLLRAAGTKLNSYPKFEKKTQRALFLRNKKVFLMN